VQFLGATVGSLAFAAVTEGVPVTPASHGGLGAVLAVVALATAGTLVPFTLFAFGQSRVSAEVAGAFLNLEPLVGALAGAVAFGDPVGPGQIAGGLAIVAGIGLSSLPLITSRKARVAAADAPVAAAAGSLVLAAAPAPAAAADAAGVTALGHRCDNEAIRVAPLPQPRPGPAVAAVGGRRVRQRPRPPRCADGRPAARAA
jgi:EamA-like transporter family